MASLTKTGIHSTDTEEGNEYLLCARYGECEDMVAFVKWGVPVDYVNASKSTALHYACANGHLDCVQALVTELNAKHLPNLSNNYPLHWAVDNKHKEIVTLLCSRKDNYVDVLAKNGFGKSALTSGFASEDADVVKMLLEHSSADALEKNRTKTTRKPKPKLKPKPKKKTNGETKTTTAATTNTDNIQKEINGVSTPTPTSTTTTTTTTTTDTTDTTTITEGETKQNKETTEKEIVEEQGPPAERQVKQRVIHVFDLASTPTGNAPTLVRVQELAIDWEGASFTEDDDASQDVTGLYVWSASVVLARWLVSDPSVVNSLANKTICELGAGAGLPGIAVAAHTKATSVVLTDLFTHTVKNMQDNITMNAVAMKESGVQVTTSSLDWSDTKQWPVQKLDCLDW